MRKTIYILFAILGMSLFAGCDDDKKDNNTPWPSNSSENGA